MALVDHELNALYHFVPADAVQDVVDFLHSYKIHLKVKKDRTTVLGDYRPAHNGKPHTISVNGTLNKYHFLITFIHELAHLVNYLNHQLNVNPHGREWKTVFATLLNRFTTKKIFPPDIEEAIQQSIHNLSASTCSDPVLYRALLKYDENMGMTLVENIRPGELFRTTKGGVFKMLTKRRTRYECTEIKSGKKYLFPGIYEVFKE